MKIKKFIDIKQIKEEGKLYPVALKHINENKSSMFVFKKIDNKLKIYRYLGINKISKKLKIKDTNKDIRINRAGIIHKTDFLVCPCCNKNRLILFYDSSEDTFKCINCLDKT